MSAIPPISVSASSLLQAGGASLDKAAAEFNAPNPWLIPEDSATIPSNPWLVPEDSASQSPNPLQSLDSVLKSPTAGPIDPLIAGVTDLLLAKLQVGAGSLLVRADTEHRKQIFDLLNPQSSS